VSESNVIISLRGFCWGSGRECDNGLTGTVDCLVGKDNLDCKSLGVNVTGESDGE
jgi:hypothetical protein